MTEGDSVATARVMKLIDAQNGLMECKVCGTQHVAKLGDNGHYFRGSWQCMHSCELPTRDEPRAYNGRRSAWVARSEMSHPGTK